MSREIVLLTSGLYSFMMTAEPVLVSQRPITGQVTSDLLDSGRTLQQRFAEARRQAGGTMVETIDEISADLSDMVSELDSRRPLRARLLSLWQALGAHYEALVHDIHRKHWAIPDEARLGQIKPRNITRNLFHMAMGVLGIGLYEFVFTRTTTLIVAGSILAVFVFLELLRRRSAKWNGRLYGKAFAKISRPNEAHRICTSTWYMSGLFFGVLLLPKHAIELGTLVLAFGDPVASLVGKRWGKVKLFEDKSLIGTLSLFAVSTLLCFTFISWRIPTVSIWAALGISAAVATAGAMAELLSTRLNDNVSIPLVAGAMAMLLL